MRSKKIHEAQTFGDHTITIHEYDRWVSLALDGHCLLITETREHGDRLVKSIADKLKFALDAPFRRKKRRVAA